MRKKSTGTPGFLSGSEGKSSKRLSALLALGAALLFPVIAGLLKLETPTTEITIAFLVYSAAMQGVSYLSEKKKG